MAAQKGVKTDRHPPGNGLTWYFLKDAFMEILEQLDATSLIVLIAAALIIVLALFAKFIKGILKLAIIAVMALCRLYVLRQAGII
jgi:hypothetical protein